MASSFRRAIDCYIGSKAHHARNIVIQQADTAHTRDRLLRAQGWLLIAGTQLQQLMSSLKKSELPQSPSSGSNQSAAASPYRQRTPDAIVE